MVSLSQLTVGGLTSFMVYAAWVGISVGGKKNEKTKLMIDSKLQTGNKKQ